LLPSIFIFILLTCFVILVERWSGHDAWCGSYGAPLVPQQEIFFIWCAPILHGDDDDNERMNFNVA